jgi:hypothetical protein
MSNQTDYRFYLADLIDKAKLHSERMGLSFDMGTIIMRSNDNPDMWVIMSDESPAFQGELEKLCQQPKEDLEMKYIQNKP